MPVTPDSEIVLLVQRGYPDASVAHLTGQSPDVVRALRLRCAMKAGRTERQDFRISSPALAVLADEAKKRKTSPSELARQIIETALAGGPKFSPMLEALLDE